ncbi:hypothetical protein ACFFX0_09060 [Citricoccus parietis]|uniref:Uncharacterized protein n=1 Tax=Citricoccus parietis TaxID=592307 RepID=A0ABV5FXH6_9MICC
MHGGSPAAVLCASTGATAEACHPAGSRARLVGRLQQPRFESPQPRGACPRPDVCRGPRPGGLGGEHGQIPIAGLVPPWAGTEGLSELRGAGLRHGPRDSGPRD